MAAPSTTRIIAAGAIGRTFFPGQDPFLALLSFKETYQAPLDAVPAAAD
jgi:hypothetical protein